MTELELLTVFALVSMILAAAFLVVALGAALLVGAAHVFLASVYLLWNYLTKRKDPAS